MDLNFSAEEEAFRTEVRAFLDTELPPELSAKGRAGPDERRHAALACDPEPARLAGQPLAG